MDFLDIDRESYTLNPNFRSNNMSRAAMEILILCVYIYIIICIYINIYIYTYIYIYTSP